MTNEEKALGEAVAALYFDDNYDYQSALWKIVGLLGGNDATTLLENEPQAAYDKYSVCRLIPSEELTVSVDESEAKEKIEEMRNVFYKIVALSDGWDDEGSTGPKEPFCWETIARVAMDYARAELK